MNGTELLELGWRKNEVVRVKQTGIQQSEGELRSSSRPRTACSEPSLDRLRVYSRLCNLNVSPSRLRAAVGDCDARSLEVGGIAITGDKAH